MLNSFALTLTVVIAATGSAHAFDDTGPDPVDALLACRDVADARARLSCQDAAIADFAAGLEAGRFDVVAAAEPSQSAIARFTGMFQRDGSDAPPPSQANQEEVQEDGSVAVFDEAGEVDEMRGLPVARVSIDRFDKLTVHLENGQVWTQSEQEFVSPPREDALSGLTATIERGMFGARFMELSHNGRRFRVRRID